MIPAVLAILTASLLGSLHCVGMCGAFVALAVAGDKASPARLHAAYNFGRLVTYVTLGALAGAAGHALDLGGEYVGLPRSAAVLAGVVMVAFGVSAVLRSLGIRVPRMPIPGVMRSAAEYGYRHVDGLSPVARAGALGLLTTLLPCGWLYAFVATAAGTASPLWGAAAMAAFWLGTVPALVTLGVGVQKLSGPLRRHVPVLTSVVLVVIGVATAFGRLNVSTLGAGIRSADLVSISNAAHETPPCCAEPDGEDATTP
ncbi:hypothetical protein PHYC_00089 [Phycisphaerales bacterium]|nr:hypothetical protein PHYC_00089 [Phycisphaerales bacterium]